MNQSISKITFNGDDNLQLLLQDHPDVVKTVYGLISEVMNANITVFTAARDEDLSLEWLVQIRSPEGQRSIRLFQNEPGGKISSSSSNL